MNEKGILIAVSLNNEFLLSWWWSKYSLNCSLPVVFVDFGMSEKAWSFCEERGRIIDIQKPFEHGFKENLTLCRQQILNIQSEKDQLDRAHSFQRAQACSMSPFSKTLWLDLSCEVRRDLGSIMDFSDNPLGIALSIDPMWTFSYLMKEDLRPLNIWPDDTHKVVTIMNTGVICFKKESKAISLWAHECLHHSHRYVSDKEALSFVIEQLQLPCTILSGNYHWLHQLGPNDSAFIYQWDTRRGREALEKAITAF